MNITIRKAIEADYPAIFGLITELSIFEKVPHKLTNSLETMIREKENFFAFVAVSAAQEIMGYATYNPVYYTWVGKSIYMDDLYVKSEHRGLGLGFKLIQAVIEYARATGCHKVCWQVSGWNERAIRFYVSLGAKIDDVEKNCDLILQ